MAVYRDNGISSQLLAITTIMCFTVDLFAQCKKNKIKKGYCRKCDFPKLNKYGNGLGSLKVIICQYKQEKTCNTNKTKKIDI